PALRNPAFWLLFLGGWLDMVLRAPLHNAPDQEPLRGLFLDLRLIRRLIAAAGMVGIVVIVHQAHELEQPRLLALLPIVAQGSVLAACLVGLCDHRWLERARAGMLFVGPQFDECGCPPDCSLREFCRGGRDD